MSREGRIYVGGLPPDARTSDIEDIFYKYGRITDIDLKPRRPNPFAFVEFEDTRDADDAVRGRDGYDFDGFRLRVEPPRGRGGARVGGGDRERYSDRSNSDRPRFGYMGRGGRGPPPRRGDYRVSVSGLPASGSWQDLKDHMREAGDVTFTDVYRDGTGVVEFSRRSDMEYALKNLDDTQFKSHEGETGYIRIQIEGQARGGGGGGARGRSYSRSRSRSPRSRSPRSRSRSYSPRRSPSRSPSRSPRAGSGPVRGGSRSPSP